MDSASRGDGRKVRPRVGAGESLCDEWIARKPLEAVGMPYGGAVGTEASEFGPTLARRAWKGYLAQGPNVGSDLEVSHCTALMRLPFEFRVGCGVWASGCRHLRHLRSGLMVGENPRRPWRTFPWMRRYSRTPSSAPGFVGDGWIVPWTSAG